MKAMAWAAAVAIGVAATAASIEAQVPLTLKGGVNLTNFIGGDAGSTDRARGLNLGASFGLVRVQRVELTAELYYRQKGAIGSLTELDTFAPPDTGAETPAQSIEVGLDYVEIPVMARVDLGRRGSRFFPYVFGGPAFGWRIDCGVAAGGLGGQVQPEAKCDDLTQDLGRTFRSYEIGVILGGGVDFALPHGIGALNLDARYTGGLSTVGEGAEALDIRNQAFTVMLGWSFSAPTFGGPGVTGV